jgi:hypothetical protein
MIRAQDDDCDLGLGAEVSLGADVMVKTSGLRVESCMDHGLGIKDQC